MPVPVTASGDLRGLGERRAATACIGLSLAVSLTNSICLAIGVGSSAERRVERR